MRGGKREGSGRKPKSDEVKLIQRLDNIIDQDKALQTLSDLIEAGNIQAMKMYLQYRYGIPRDSIELDSVEHREPLKIVIIESTMDDESDDLKQQ